MAALAYTITPSQGQTPFVVTDGGAGSTQQTAANYAAGVTDGNPDAFTGEQHPEYLSPRMRTFKANAEGAGGAGSENYGCYCFDPNYVLQNPRGQIFNVSAGV